MDIYTDVCDSCGTTNLHCGTKIGEKKSRINFLNMRRILSILRSR